MKRTKKVNIDGPSLKIIPLGGLEQIGMNITAFEYEDSIIVVDCGLAFPEDDMYGVDLVIPDFSYVERNKERIKGLVITHGHEDHIGAPPYVLKEINLPIYTTKLTMGIIENKLKESDIESADLIVFANDVGITKAERFNTYKDKIIKVTPHEVIKNPKIIFGE